MSRYFLKTCFVYARPIPVQIKVHFKKMQFLAVTYDMGVLKLCFRCCLNWQCLFSLLNRILETKMTWSQPNIVR